MWRRMGDYEGLNCININKIVLTNKTKIIMRQFVKSVVPTEGYEEVKKVGSKYVVHLEGVPSGEADGTTACWETMTDGEPDMAALTEELQAWKAYVAELELTSAVSSKQREILSYDSQLFLFKLYPDSNPKLFCPLFAKRQSRTVISFPTSHISQLLSSSLCYYEQ
jgi:hypothetical protein